MVTALDVFSVVRHYVKKISVWNWVLLIWRLKTNIIGIADKSSSWSFRICKCSRFNLCVRSGAVPYLLGEFVLYIYRRIIIVTVARDVIGNVWMTLCDRKFGDCAVSNWSGQMAKYVSFWRLKTKMKGMQSSHMFLNGYSPNQKTFGEKEIKQLPECWKWKLLWRIIFFNQSRLYLNHLVGSNFVHLFFGDQQNKGITTAFP